MPDGGIRGMWASCPRWQRATPLQGHPPARGPQGCGSAGSWRNWRQGLGSTGSGTKNRLNDAWRIRLADRSTRTREGHDCRHAVGAPRRMQSGEGGASGQRPPDRGESEDALRRWRADGVLRLMSSTSDASDQQAAANDKSSILIVASYLSRTSLRALADLVFGGAALALLLTWLVLAIAGGLT